MELQLVLFYYMLCYKPHFIRNLGHCYQTEYKLNGNKLQEVEAEKGLGITATNKPSVECAKAAAKAIQVL